jgi:hypothetical protein
MFGHSTKLAYTATSGSKLHPVLKGMVIFAMGFKVCVMIWALKIKIDRLRELERIEKEKLKVKKPE